MPTGCGAIGVNGDKGVVVEEGGTVVAGVESWGGSAARIKALRSSWALDARVRADSAMSATALAQGNCNAAAFVFATVAASASDNASEHRSIFALRPACCALL